MFLRRLRGKGEVQLTHTTLEGAGRWTYCLSFGMAEQITLSAEELGLVSGATGSIDSGDGGGSSAAAAAGDLQQPSFGVAWARTNLQPFGVSADGRELKRFSSTAAAAASSSSSLPSAAAAPLSLAMQPPEKDWGLYTYWRTAPTSCNGKGWTLLGEMGKLISVSAQRIVNVTVSCDNDDDNDNNAIISHDNIISHDVGAPTMSVSVVGTEGELVALSFLAPAPSMSVLTVDLELGGDGTARAVCGISGKCAQAK